MILEWIRLVQDNDWEGTIEMVDEYFETIKDVQKWAQKEASNDYEEFASDPWNFIDDSPYNHKKVKW